MSWNSIFQILNDVFTCIANHYKKGGMLRRIEQPNKLIESLKETYTDSLFYLSRLR